MFRKIIDFTSNFDSFPSLFNFSVKTEGGNKFKSALGGIISLFIYLIGLLYFIYLLYQWRNNQFLPKITSQKSMATSFSQLELKYSPILIEIAGDQKLQQKYQGRKLFNSQLTIFKNLTQEIQTTYNFSDCSSKNPRLFDSVCLNTSNESLLIIFTQNSIETHYIAQDPKEIKNNILFRIDLIYCDNKVDDQCLSQEEITELLRQKSVNIRFQVFFDSFDFISEKLIPAPQVYNYIIDFSFTKIFKIRLKRGTYIIDSNFVISEKKLTNSIYDAEILIETISREIYSQREKQPIGSAAQFWIVLDGQEATINIQFIKISELLAMFGSIFSILLTIGIPMNIINERLMNKKIVSNYIKSLFKLNKKLHDKEIKHISNRIGEKLNISNLMADITRIQYAIFLLIGRQEYERVHEIKFNQQLILKQKKKQQSEGINMENQQDLNQLREETNQQIEFQKVYFKHNKYKIIRQPQIQNEEKLPGLGMLDSRHKASSSKEIL